MMNQATAEALQRAATYLMAAVVGGGTCWCFAMMIRNEFREAREASREAKALRRERRRMDKERNDWAELLSVRDNQLKRQASEIEMLKELLKKSEELKEQLRKRVQDENT